MKILISNSSRYFMSLIMDAPPQKTVKDFVKRLDFYHYLVETKENHTPIGKLLNLQFIHAEEGTTTFELEHRSDFVNAYGIMHGGIVALLADTAMGTAYGTYFNTDVVFKTIEMKINFIRPVSQGKITAIGKVIHKGSRIGVVEAEIWSSEKKLVAKAQGTMTF